MSLPKNDSEPRPIVCLECANLQLYGELIQQIPSRDRAWVRPRWLRQGENIYPLDDAIADLVWPSADFRPALDVEVLPLLTTPLTAETAAQGRQLLQQLVRKLARS